MKPCKKILFVLTLAYVLLMPDGVLFAQTNNHRANVLFIGNSYTQVNNLPQVIHDLALSGGDTLTFDANVIGGYTLQMHSTNAVTLGKIATGNWEYVVLQEQSQLPSFPRAEVDTEVFPYAGFLDSVNHHYNSCGRTMFYMTWGRKNGDASNCASWPPVCTYAGMDSMLRSSYMDLADSNEAIVSPVGAVWRYIRANFPAIDLYQADESHPLAAGTYAAACCFYVAVFHRNPTLLTYDYSLSAADAGNIRSAAKNVVFDSLAKWHIGQYDPLANFTFSAGAGQHVSFTNGSANATTYSWDFGDGQTSSLASPGHTYAAGGTYTVTLTAINCNQSDTVIAVVHILPSGLMNHEPAAEAFIISPNPAQQILNIHSALFINNAYDIRIVNGMGQTVYTSKSMLSHDSQSISLSGFPKGLYLISITRNGRNVYSGNVIKK